MNRKNGHGQTAIFTAVGHGNREMLHLLIDHGADVNTKDNKYQTPLHLAIKTNSPLVDDLVR